MKQRDNIKTKVRGVSVVRGLSSFCVLALLCATLSTCENPQVIAILKAPSELDFLSVIAYTGAYTVPGGASMEPNYRTDVYEYTAYVDKDSTHVSINGGFDDKGTVTVYSENDHVTGNADTRFDLLGDEAAFSVTATRQHMETAQYRVRVIRGEPIPTARDVEISVEPGIAAYFIGSGVVPTLRVTAVPPGAGIVLNYQWYVNDENNTRTGNPITGANEDSYKMQAIETMVERSVYYYVDITTVVDGRTGITQSAPCRVSFVNKGTFNEKSFSQNYMADIPAGTVYSAEHPEWNISFMEGDGLDSVDDWSTPGYRMGRYLVTWELWETIFKHAERGNYRFAKEGNQGGANLSNNTNRIRYPVGNKLNPVTNIMWRDAVVWCNAYSEMDGLEPVYRDSGGEPLRNSRASVERLYDAENMDFNGYRLPTLEEWTYAARGANPSGSHWDDNWPGINSNDSDELAQYLWQYTPEVAGIKTTGEVGSLLPNQLWNGSRYVDGLYDMAAMVDQWIDYRYAMLDANGWPFIGGSFDTYYFDYNDYPIVYYFYIPLVIGAGSGGLGSYILFYIGFRIAQGGGR